MGAKNFNFQKGLEEGDLSLDDLDASGMDDATSIKLNFDEEEEPIELLEEEVVDDDDGVDIAMDFAMKIEEASSERESDQTDLDEGANPSKVDKPELPSDADDTLTVNLQEGENQSLISENDNSLDSDTEVIEHAVNLESHTAEEAALVSGMGKELLLNIQHDLSVELGRVRMSGIDIMELTHGCVVELEKIAGDPVDLVMNGKVVAFGEIVLINNQKLGIRIIGINQTD